ncbi:MAG: D-alanine--D-alanine ligase [Candidatus Lokiarchaeota archaeon]|nr:D-alanine--D-alanine ligase [Candidatus Lokiarchaeota archaeon]
MSFDALQSPSRTTYSKTVHVPHSTSIFTSKTESVFQKPLGINCIGFAYNARPDVSTPLSNSVALEYDEAETIEAIQSALNSWGFEVELLPVNCDFIEALKTRSVDFVFNIAEGIRGESRESHIPAILEMLGIPYTGSGVLTQALTLSKSRTKEILGFYHIPTPRYQVFRAPSDLLGPLMKFPLIIKPDAQGSSAGITNRSVVHSLDELRAQTHWVFQEFGAPVLVEEFLPGKEFTVGILGNDPPLVLPIIEVNFNHLPPGYAKIDSYESKWTYDVPGQGATPLTCPANISEKLRQEIERIALKTYKALDCVDLCRMDIRLSKRGVPNVLEINALPGLNPNPEFHSRFPYACEVAGLSYSQMIKMILYSALKRYNLVQ